MRKKSLCIFFIIPLILSIFSATMIGVATAQDAHDIAVTSISTTRVTTGELVNVKVVVKNDGTVNETFNVTLYYDSTAIKTQNVTDLALDANTTLLFVWNTTDVLAGTYTIKAEASRVEGETNIDNNILASPIEVEIKSTYIAIVPQNTVDITLDIGKNYTVSIYTDYNGTDVWGYEFTLTWNPNVLQGINVTNGDLITGTEVTWIPGTFDNVNGKLSTTGAKFEFTTPPAPVTSGPGTLANVTFTVVDIGDSDIILGTETVAPSRLIGIDEFGEKYNIIDDITPHPALGHILHGYFKNTLEEVIHDVAVVSVTPNATLVEAGELVNITVVVGNQGTVAETFDVKVYYDYIAANWLIGTQTISTLGAEASISLTFTWDTTDVGKGKHTVIAVAMPVPGETDTEDNIGKSDEIVTVHARAIYIRADGSVDPDTAPISSVDNVTYTFTGNIYDSIVVERDNIVVDGAGYTVQGTVGMVNGIELSGRSNVTIRNMEIKAFYYGILLDSSSNNYIYGNNITDNTIDGIYLDRSPNNNISENNITNTRWNGICLQWSTDNIIAENNIANNRIGVSIEGSSNYTSISGNDIENNTVGLVFLLSSISSISRNNIANNEIGIAFYSSSNSSVSKNDITNNSLYGIDLHRSSGNTIYRNNFIDNTQHIHDSLIGGPWFSPSINTWDDGYPSGGNYWSDYEERYPDAEELDGSGIWATPYFIDENNQDNYPLMNPWTATPPVVTATLDIDPDTLNLKSKGKWITAYIELSENHNVSNINRTTVLLNRTIPIDSFWIDKPLESVIGDCDNDGITDLMVKFDRQALIEYLKTKGTTDAEVTIAITGETNGKSFEVTDTIKVIGQ